MSRREGIWRPEAGASEAALRRLIDDSPIAFPESYISQLRESDGGEGELAIEPGWVVFWKAAEVAKANRAYHVLERVPGLYGFGSNGAGELLAFDLRGGPPYAVVMVPFLPMEPRETVRIAANFDEFRTSIGALPRRGK